jgi:dynein light chain Tctex-type 1
LSDPHSSTEADSNTGEKDGQQEVKGKVGRRGMHSASGAYWNNERDGMWSYKYEGGEGKGMDIVVSVMWIGV